MKEKAAEKIMRKLVAIGKERDITIEDLMNMNLVKKFPDSKIYQLNKEQYFYRIGVYKEGRVDVRKYEKNQWKEA